MKKEFLFILFLLGSVRIYAQSDILAKKVKIEATEGTVGNILKEISDKGGFFISYNQDIPKYKYITLKHSKQTVQQYLDEIFKKRIYCVEFGNKLIIMQKPALPKVYSIRGKVVDSETKETIPGVTIFIPGSEPLIGSVSYPSGNFQIDVPSHEDIVKLTCIGYKSDSIKPGLSNIIDIELNPDKLELDEVEITYNQKPKEEKVNSAVSNITAEKLERQPLNGIENALQGNSTGVHVVRNSGMPGASLQVKIRGINSLINSDPYLFP